MYRSPSLSQRFMVICPYRLVNASARRSRTPGSASPGSASCIRLAVFVFRNLRRSADRPAVCCHLPSYSRQCLITVWCGFPSTAPKGPACVVLPVQMVLKKAWPSPDTEYAQCRIRHGADRRRSSTKKETKYNLIFCNSSDTIFRQTPVHDFVLSPDTVHRDALLLSHRSGGFPVHTPLRNTCRSTRFTSNYGKVCGGKGVGRLHLYHYHC